jgi:hypothetical protein
MTKDDWLMRFAARQWRANGIHDPAALLERACAVYAAWQQSDPLLAADLDAMNRGVSLFDRTDASRLVGSFESERVRWIFEFSWELAELGIKMPAQYVWDRGAFLFEEFRRTDARGAAQLDWFLHGQSDSGVHA